MTDKKPNGQPSKLFRANNPIPPVAMKAAASPKRPGTPDHPDTLGNNPIPPRPISQPKPKT